MEVKNVSKGRNVFYTVFDRAGSMFNDSTQKKVLAKTIK